MDNFKEILQISILLSLKEQSEITTAHRSGMMNSQDESEREVLSPGKKKASPHWTQVSFLYILESQVQIQSVSQTCLSSYPSCRNSESWDVFHTAVRSFRSGLYNLASLKTEWNTSLRRVFVLECVSLSELSAPSSFPLTTTSVTPPSLISSVQVKPVSRNQHEDQVWL